MKVHVTMKLSCKAGQSTDFDSVVYPVDTALCLKTRLLETQAVPFEKTDLAFKGQVLEDDTKLCDCGVVEGAAVELRVHASEGTIVEQLIELLGPRALTCDELGLVYTYKYGVSAKHALSLLGIKESLQEFAAAQKAFVVVNGLITSASAEIPLRISVKTCSRKHATTIDIPAKPSETVEQVKIRAVASAQLPAAFPAAKVFLQRKEIDDAALVLDCGLQPNIELELVPASSEEILSTQLNGLLIAHDSMSILDLGLLYSCKYGATADEVVSTLGVGRRLVDFLRQQRNWFVVKGGCVTRSCPEFDICSKFCCEVPSTHDRCIELHDRISSRRFRSEASRAVSKVVALLMDAAFFNIHHYVVGGSIGNGTAIVGSATAEVTFFLDDLPKDDCSELLPGFLASIAHGLRALSSSLQLLEVKTDAIHVSAAGLPLLVLRVSPVFDTYAAALDVLTAQAPEDRSSYAAPLAEQRVRFIKGQPEPVKATARLLKYWRGQQTWSCPAAQPSDDLFELLAVHVASQHPGVERYDHGAALSLAKSIMEDFSSQCIKLPAALYDASKVAEDVQLQRPLLMDPVNPFDNVVNATVFDHRELMANAASAPRALICFD